MNKKITNPLIFRVIYTTFLLKGSKLKGEPKGIYTLNLKGGQMEDPQGTNDI